ncbi:MAG: YfbK domain-containing protein, partial [Chitinophagaceae bacterium]
YIKGGNNRVILATDGDFNVGIRNEAELEQLIEREKHGGIYLTCLGVGMGDYKDSKIQVLAQKGNGNFAYLDSYAEAEKVLFKEFFQTLYTVADNAAINIRFDTAFVDQYRLIGYDNKIAAIRDTTALVQGGEVGSGSSLMMVFEIVPGRGPLQLDKTMIAEVAIHYTSKINSGQGEYKYQIPKLLYDFNQLEEDYRFASAVIMLGMKLKKSVHAKKIKWDLILNTVNDAFMKQSVTRIEFLELVEIAKKGIKKKKKFLFFNVKEE